MNNTIVFIANLTTGADSDDGNDVLNRICVEEVKSESTIYTTYKVIFEKHRKISKDEHCNNALLPLENSSVFYIVYNGDLSSDDETTVFEPYIDFIEETFHSHFNYLVQDINMKKRLKQNPQKEDFSNEIKKLRKDFEESALAHCYFDKSQLKMVYNITNKLFHILIQLKIDPLFCDKKKENPHISKRKKVSKRDVLLEKSLF